MTTRFGSYLLIFSFLSLVDPVDLSAQQKDFQSWWEIALDKDLGKNFELSGEFEQRFRNNSLQYDRSQISLAGEYGINKYLDIAAGARTVLANSRELRLNIKYRLHVEATGKYSAAGFDLSLRVRLQYGFEDLFDPAFEGRNNFGNRFRLKVSRHIFGTRIDWFASTESWSLLNDNSGILFYKMRYAAGVQYNLSFDSQVNVSYLLEDEFNIRDPLQSYILVIGYSHSF